MTRDFRPCPKPEKPVRGTKECADYMREVRLLGCIICGNDVEVEVHHAMAGRFSQRKDSDLSVYALCGAHHRLLHRSPATFEQMYGFEDDLVAETRKAVERARKSFIGGR